MLFLIFALFIGSAIARPNDPKVVGGLPAREGQFPYIARIGVQFKDFVSGSIISDEWILTSANIQNVEATYLYVIVGTISIDDDTGTKYDVSEVVVYPNFNQSNPFANNIGLAKVKGKIQLGGNVGTIGLSSLTQIPPNEPVTFAGWGHPSFWVPVISDTLHYITLKSTTIEDCNRPYPPGKPQAINSTHVCTGSDDGNGPCLYDTGSPLIYNNQLVGIEFWGYSCAPPFVPAIYTSVGYHRSWINEVTGI